MLQRTNLARRKGFTLIEILVVIVIIGILATLGIGKYAQFSRDARRSGCVNNQNTIDKGIGLWESKYVSFALKAGTGDSLSCEFKGNGEKVPGTPTGTGRFPTRFTNTNKADEVYDLIQEESAFICPETMLAFEGVENISASEKAGFKDYTWFMFARGTTGTALEHTGGRLRGTGCQFWGTVAKLAPNSPRGKSGQTVIGGDGTFGPSGTDEDIHSGVI